MYKSTAVSTFLPIVGAAADLWKSNKYISMGGEYAKKGAKECAARLLLAYNHHRLNEFYSSMKLPSYLYECALSLFKTLNDAAFYQAYNRMRWQTSSTQLSSTSQSVSFVEITTISIEFSRGFHGNQFQIEQQTK